MDSVAFWFSEGGWKTVFVILLFSVFIGGLFLLPSFFNNTAKEQITTLEEQTAPLATETANTIQDTFTRSGAQLSQGLPKESAEGIKNSFNLLGFSFSILIIGSFFAVFLAIKSKLSH